MSITHALPALENRPHVGVLLVAATTAALVSLLMAGAARSATPSSGQIAFTRFVGVSQGIWIYVMREDGSGVRVLRRGVVSGMLAWSPDGSKLALSGGGGILVMDADGSDLERLVAGGDGLSRPTWSPKGDRIAFLGRPLGRSRLGIWVMNADGGNLHRISTPRLDRMTFVGWGPFDIDWGSTGRLVFTAAGGSRFGIGIYVMNADGGNLRDITPDGRPFGTPHDPNPDWSPDGRRIAYVRHLHVWVMNADGRSPVRLTDNGSTEVGPDWSPDGRRIVFERLGSKGSEIVVMNADGTRVRRLTEGGGPRWRPVAPGQE